MLDTHRILDTSFLEDLLNDDCKCESRTHDNGEVNCSGTVRYRIFSCTAPVNVCRAMGEHALKSVADMDSECGDCERDLEKCWTIRPI